MSQVTFRMSEIKYLQLYVASNERTRRKEKNKKVQQRYQKTLCKKGVLVACVFDHVLEGGGGSDWVMDLKWGQAGSWGEGKESNLEEVPRHSFG